jgi:hypothetical protein
MYLCNLVMHTQWMESTELCINLRPISDSVFDSIHVMAFHLHHHHGCYPRHCSGFDEELMGCIVLDEELEYAEFAVEDLCKGPENLQRLNLIYLCLFHLYGFIFFQKFKKIHLFHCRYCFIKI